MKYFFSYARDDAEFVLRLARDLRSAGVPLWLDQLDIRAGQRWDEAVEQALHACRGMIVVLSPGSVASRNVMDEVSFALEEHKLLIPVLLERCAIPFRLRRVQRIDFTQPYDRALVQLRSALDSGTGNDSTPTIGPGAASSQEPPPSAERLRSPETARGERSAAADALPLRDGITAASFSGAQAEQSFALGKSIIESLREKQWTDERLAVVEFCFQEVVANAFVHGVHENPSGTVRVDCTLTLESCAIRVTDDGDGFDLPHELSRQAAPGAQKALHRVSELALLSQYHATAGGDVPSVRGREHSISVVIDKDLRWNIEDRGANVVFKWSGRIDMAYAKVFHGHFIPLVSRTDAGAGCVIFDMSGVDYVSSAGWRVVTLAAKEARASGARFALAGPQPLVREFLKLARYDKVLQIFATVEDALEHFRA